MNFFEGQTVRLGDARWFEHKNPFHKGVLDEGEVVTLLTTPEPLERPSRFRKCQVYTAWVLHQNTIGFVRLTEWVDEVCDEKRAA